MFGNKKRYGVIETDNIDDIILHATCESPIWTLTPQWRLSRDRNRPLPIYQNKIVFDIQIYKFVHFCYSSINRPTATIENYWKWSVESVYHSCLLATALDSVTNQTAGSGGHPRYVRKSMVCMPQCVCCVQASRKAPATRRNRVNS